MRELKDYALNCLEAEGTQKAECRIVRSEKQELTVEAGQLQLMRTVYNTNIILAGIIDQRRGSTTINKSGESDIGTAAKQVVEMAKSAEGDPAHDIAPSQQRQSFAAGPKQPDTDLMYQRLEQFLGQVKQQFPKVILESMVLDFSRTQQFFANSNGVDFDAEKGVYRCSMMVLAKDGEQSSSFNHTSFSTASLDKDLLEYGSVATLLRQAEEQIFPKRISGKFVGDVILTPDSLESFVNFFVDNSLRDYPLITKTSIFQEKLDQRIAAPCFSLYSQPLSEQIVDGYFFTGDGFIAENSTIVDSGVLQGFILSQYGANKTGRERAVNGGGAYVVAPGDKSLSEMVKSVERGIVLGRFSGGKPSSNGDFSGVAKNSYLIEDGQIKYPISESMIAGNIAELLMSIGAVSQEQIHFGSCSMPWALTSGVTISGA